ncbi:MAG: NAD(P)/FAD-dependent oxidoreductase [Deltaproteobacteria bacterium]|nr:NAD(P)/FAD-dependent oxidoreductase [Deltaproteobacteria bacterium]
MKSKTDYRSREKSGVAPGLDPSARRLPKEPRVLIIGGGFGGLALAKAAAKLPVRVTLVDRRNYHLFQPLLYQVATATLAPGDIAVPFREIFRGDRNVRFIQSEAMELDPERRVVHLRSGREPYDLLVVATGSEDNDLRSSSWAAHSLPLKTVEDSIAIRARVLAALETAEQQYADHNARGALTTFVIVGGGPTGVELAGALADLTQSTLRKNYRSIDAREAKIMLIQADDRLLPQYRPALSYDAERRLRSLGVDVRISTRVVDIGRGYVLLDSQGKRERVLTATVMRAIGVRPSGLADLLRRRLNALSDASGRILVTPRLALLRSSDTSTHQGPEDVFVIGDLAALDDGSGSPLPGQAPVAIQQGKYLAKYISARLQGKNIEPFRYRDAGQLAVIGRGAAVAQLPHVSLRGLPAWLIWAVVHLGQLIGFDNKLLVLGRWFWNYLTHQRQNMLITGELGSSSRLFGYHLPELEIARSEDKTRPVELGTRKKVIP